MDPTNSFEKLVQQQFEDFHSEVNPQLWNNIASRLPASAPGIQTGTKGLLKSFSVKTVITAVSAIIASTALVYYVTTKDHSPAFPEHKPVPSQTASPAVSKEENTGSTASVNPASEKNTQQKNIAAPSIPASSSPVNSMEMPNNPENTGTIDNKAIPAGAGQANELHPVPPATVSQNDQKGNASQPENKPFNQQPQNLNNNNSKLCDEVLDKIRIPNIFTPDGDGRNDQFYIPSAEEFLKSLDVKIFTYSGKPVYDWNGLNGSWDGKLKDGRDAEKGNYYCIVKFETRNGTVCTKQLTLRLNR